jgi:hypothetical protein
MDQVSGDKAELIARYNKLLAHYNWMVNEGFTDQDPELVALGRKLAELKHAFTQPTIASLSPATGATGFHDFLFCLGLMVVITLPCILFGKLGCDIVLYTGERSST